MTDNNKILYTLKIEGAQEELERLRQLNEHAKTLRNEIKRLEAAGDQQAEAAKLNLQEVQGEYKKLQKEIQARNKAEQDGVRTLNTMRVELSKLYTELDNVQVGSQRFNELTQKAAALRNEIAGAEGASGRFFRNVGNYAGDISKAFAGIGLNIDGARVALNNITTATSMATGIFSKLRVALAALGLPLLLSAVTGLVGIMGKFPGVLDTINKILMPVQMVLQSLVGTVEKFGSGLITLIRGDIPGGLRDMRDSLAGIGKSMREAANDGQRLAELTRLQRAYRLEVVANEQNILAAMEKQKEIATNTTATLAERNKAQKLYLDYNNALAELKTRELTAALEELKIKNKQNQTDQAGLLKEAELTNQINAIERERVAKARELNNMIAALNKRYEDLAKAQEEAIKKANAEIEKDTINSVQKLLTEAERIWTRAAVKEPIIKIIDEDEIDDLPQILQSYGNLLKSELELARATTQEIKDTYGERLKALRALYDAQAITDREYAARKKDLNMQIMTDTIAALKSTAMEGSKIQRGLFVFEQAIKTREAFMALQAGLAKTGAAVPFPANLPLMAAFAAQLAGLIAAIKNLTAPALPKFASGVIGLRGPGTETSDSITARLSAGESVMTAKATKRFAPQLAAMELAVGNVPNVQLGNRRFSGGYIGGDVPDFEQIINNAVKKIAQIPVVVSERDITTTQEKVRKIKTLGNL